jgi:putative DNA methylase
MSHPIKSPRKLIEVSLPLDSINRSAAAEKNNPFVRRHPRSIHTWWARRPFTAARALLFCQLVNDPGSNIGRGFKYGMNKKDAALERKRLFKIVEDLVLWENTSNQGVLERARAEIHRSWREVCELNKDHPQAADLFNPDKLPAFHDPFAGGGAIPVEAQRLGLDSYATDLNPVAILINKAMIEIPAYYADRSPVNMEVAKSTQLIKNDWHGTQGLADDLTHYGAIVRTRAEKELKHLYPDVTITEQIAIGRPDLKPYIGLKRKLVAFIRARTVASPNPAFANVHVPLASTFILSSKSGKEAYIEPIVTGQSFTFRIVMGTPPASAKDGTKLSRGGNFRCLVSGSPIDAAYIRDQGMRGALGTCLLAVVVDGNRTRLYLPPVDMIDKQLTSLNADWAPEGEMYGIHRAFTPAIYGLGAWKSIFTIRQLVTLNTLFRLIDDVRDDICRDALQSKQFEDEDAARRYADAVSVYMALATSRWADFSNTICSWNSTNQNIRVMFARQAIQMSWDFAELAPFSTVGPWTSCLEANIEALSSLSTIVQGHASQMDASTQELSIGKIVATDPPYFDNVPYSDLSDFFYVWLRRSLRSVFPELFSTIAVPKDEELVATPTRHGGRVGSERFFLSGMTGAMTRLSHSAHPAFPVIIYYAFKQSETDDDDGTSSTGWVTFLEAVLVSGFQIVGTWPIRTEKQGRSRDNDSNALASSIILVCRRRTEDAITISRREFIRELNGVLPDAVDEMTKGAGGETSPVAPVDLSQAIIGPGMAVFSKYLAVLEADGSPMSVRAALQLINRFLAEDDFDADTQFCLQWFQQYGWDTGKFGEADTLARAKGTSVDGVKQAGVLHAAGGNVRLLKWAEYSGDWDPQADQRLPIWEVLHQLIRVFNTDGETGAAAIFAAIQSKAEAARQLAYRLYTLCERNNWAEDARAYNEVVTSWSGIEAAAAKESAPIQRTLFE